MLGDEKAVLRREMRARRAGLAPAWIAGASGAIAARVLALEAVCRARFVACYFARPDEVQTDGILAACWGQGRRVCVPARRPEGGYAMAAVGSDTALRAGPWGIREPVRAEWVRPGDIDCVVAPGVAFDAEGGRVGYGGGYYDRMLAAMRAAGGAPFAVGVAFDFQVLARVPVEPADVRMDAVVTDRRTIRPGGPAAARKGD